MPAMVSLERNFEEYPFFEVSRKSRKGGGPIIFSRSTGRNPELEQTWKLRVSSDLGKPAAAEQDLYVAVMVLVERVGGMPSSRELDLSLYEIASLCGLGRRQKDYDNIKEGLRRIESTHAESRQSFWSVTLQAHLNRSVNTWNTHFRDYREVRGNRSQNSSRHTLSFTTAFAKSVEEGYVSVLDSDFYFSLALPTSKRLYRLLSACTSKSSSTPRWEVEMTELRDQFPLSKSYVYKSKVEEKLEPGHKELYRGGYLSDFTFEHREEDIFAVYKLNPRFLQLREDLTLETNAANRPALQMMAAAGIPRRVRLRELRKHGPSRCYEVAELMPYQRGINNPPAIFTAMCEQGVPDWWRTAARPRVDFPGPSPGPMKLPARASVLDEGRVDGGPPDAGYDELCSQPAVAYPEADPRAKLVWDTALDALVEGQDGTPYVRGWFEGTVPTGLEGGTLTIVVPNDVACRYISDRFRQPLERLISFQLGQAATVNVVTQTSLAARVEYRTDIAGGHPVG